MNKWLKALWYDLIEQEHKNPLDLKDRINYSLYLGSAFMVLGIIGLFIHWSIALIGFGAGARKYQIYFKKRSRLE